jgi:hypothetical protein
MTGYMIVWRVNDRWWEKVNGESKNDLYPFVLFPQSERVEIFVSKFSVIIYKFYKTRK